eukprot:TRINITY_DN4043_c0_g2_i1.p1 TRINITY_DN4043_c0_g2~~TRINITY_DN4043_c0_g2_i1.p1  ORF type:complete len:374 (-),score=55.48 TRINITY_DN4043_c0_g2_i1:353-1354(-)
MVKQGAIASSLSSRRASSGALCSTGRSSPLLLPPARPRQLPRPRAPHAALASSSSSTSPADHAPSPAAAPEGSASVAPSTEPGLDQKSAQAPAAAAAAGGGQGFGATEAQKTGKEKQQQQHQGQHRRPKPSRPKQPKAPPRGNNLLVVGLGNPGDKYKMTRHNAGFLVAEELARRYGGTLKIKTAFQGEYCSVTVKGKSVGILRPITYMNNSGMSARKVMDFFKLPTNAAIVLVDEVALDFGQLRLKAKGSAGGHNGLKSVQAHFKTQEYSRLRIGVGASKFSEALSDHVLGEFTRTERKELDNIIADACDAVEHWIEEEDMAKVMTRFNSPR